MCPSGATCLPADCCLSELAQHVGQIQSGHYHLKGWNLFAPDKTEKLLIWR